MNLDDNGKERRNALLVSALLFSAAYLELKLPSFIGEYIKVEIAPTAQFKVWVLAAVLALYVAMRYHFSPSRALAAIQERAALASAFLQKSSIAAQCAQCRTQAFNMLTETPAVSRARTKDFHIAASQIEPIRIELDTPKQQMWVLWRLTDSFRAGDTSPLGKFDPLTTSPLKVHRPKRFRLQWAARQLIWSRKAWEVNTVYFACFAACYLCLRRASNLAGGWQDLVRSFI